MVNENSEIAKSPFVHKGELEFASDFGDERITVSTDENTLKRSIISAAIQQGIDREAAERSTANTKISMGTWQEYVSKDPDIHMFLKPFVKLEGPIAMVRQRKDGSTDCHINIDQIIKLVKSGKSVGTFKIPKKLPREARQLVLIQVVDKVWEHERQHLVQMMREEDRVRMDKDAKTIQKLQKVALGTIAIATPLTAYAMQLNTSEGYLFTLIGRGAIIGTSSLVMGAAHLKTHHSPYEKEAYHAMDKEHRFPSPFSLTFENKKHAMFI